MKNVNLKYRLRKKGTDETMFVSDAETLEEFIQDIEQYFDYAPRGYYPYKLRIRNTDLKNTLQYTEVNFCFERDGVSYCAEYYIDIIVCIEKAKGNSLNWNKKFSNRLK